MTKDIVYSHWEESGDDISMLIERLPSFWIFFVLETAVSSTRAALWNSESEQISKNETKSRSLMHGIDLITKVEQGRFILFCNLGELIACELNKRH